MDANLKLRLYQVGYQVFPTCTTCVHRDFEQGLSQGTHTNGLCRLFKYAPQSALYGGGEQHMMITRSGSCRFHQADTNTEAAMGSFVEFGIP